MDPSFYGSLWMDGSIPVISPANESHLERQNTVLWSQLGRVGREGAGPAVVFKNSQENSNVHSELKITSFSFTLGWCGYCSLLSVVKNRDPEWDTPEDESWLTWNPWY